MPGRDASPHVPCGRDLGRATCYGAAMQFDLTDDQREIQEVARRFTASEITPHAAKWDEEHIFPVDTIRAAAAFGFGAIYVSEASGGIGLGRIEAALIMEAMAYGCPSTSAFISIHNMASWMIDAFGSAELKARYLPGAGADGQDRQLLPDRARLRVGRGGAQDAGGARRRRLCRHRQQGVHLGRRGERRLCHHGPHRRRRAEGHQLPRHRQGHARRQLRRARAQAGLAQPADGAGQLRRRPRSRGQSRRRGRAGFRHRHAGARRRAAQHRRVLARRRAAGAR